MDKILDKIQTPKDLKKLNIEELNQLAKEIRKYLIEVVSESGGHLGSNLGVVELTLALHYVFNSPVDKIIWDVGHQSYVHKMITGRKDKLKTIRKLNGLSGFPKRSESEHDIFETGHSSTSISAALGLAKGRDLNNENYHIISVIGDGALTGGMAYEALNNASSLKTNFIIILNDNQMSISKNVGGMSVYLDKIRTGQFYNGVKDDIQKILRKIPKYGEGMINAVRDFKDSIKQLLIPGMFFEEMGFTYLGPVDGNNIRQVIKILNYAKKVEGPTIIHMRTIKGKGYQLAEKYPSKFHGIGPFDRKSGRTKNKSKYLTYSNIFGKTLLELAKNDNKIVAITAAMPDGTGLNKFGEIYPNRLFDVGIAEQHAVTFAGGLAVSGFKPFVAIYSTFLQRAYDQILHDICMQKLPVVFAIDRSGLVGKDGETHQGIFDTSFLNSMPNMTIMAPRDGNELKKMLKFASKYNNGPVSIKYPRGEAINSINENDEPIKYGKAEVLKEGKDIAIIGVGTMVEKCLKVSEKLLNNGYNTTVINTRFIKPFDDKLITELTFNHKLFIIIEEGTIIGGFGAEIVRFVNQLDASIKVMTFGIKDKFIEHGTVEELMNICELDVNSIYNKIINQLGRLNIYGK